MHTIGIDLGTGSVKAGAVDAEGRLRAVASRPYELQAPAPDRAEADPRAWWAATRGALRELVDQTGGMPGELAGLAVAGQMHGVVLVSERGDPVRPAVLWPDTRARAHLARYRRADDDALRRLGNPLAPGMMGPILLALAAEEPKTVARAAAAVSPKDWLRHQLTGSFVTEPSDASATLLWDLEADAWHDELIGWLPIDRALLPEVVPSDRPVGELAQSAARELALPPGVPVVAGAADTAAATLGAGTRPGELQLGIGTGAQWVQPLETLTFDRSRRTHRYRAAGSGWYAMAAVQNAGLAFEWAWQALAATWDEAYGALEASVPGAEGLTFLPFLTGERTPYLDPALRGGWWGAGRAHRREHLLRAVFEGVAFAIRTARDALGDHAQAAPVRLVGGGSADPSWQSMLADVLGVEVQVVDQRDATVRGAGLLARSAEGEPAPWSVPVPPVRGRRRPGPAAAAYESAFARYTERAGQAPQGP